MISAFVRVRHRVVKVRTLIWVLFTHVQQVVYSPSPVYSEVSSWNLKQRLLPSIRDSRVCDPRGTFQYLYVCSYSTNPRTINIWRPRVLNPKIFLCSEFPIRPRTSRTVPHSKRFLEQVQTESLSSEFSIRPTSIPPIHWEPSFGVPHD